MIALYIALGLVAFLFIMQMLPRLIMNKKKGKDMPQLEGKYKKAMKHRGKSLFYFYSDTCRACIPMTPVIKGLKKNYKNCFMVNSGKELSVAKQFGIMATPTTIIVNNKKIEQILVGVQSREKLEQALL